MTVFIYALVGDKNTTPESYPGAVIQIEAGTTLKNSAPVAAEPAASVVAAPLALP